MKRAEMKRSEESNGMWFTAYDLDTGLEVFTSRYGPEYLRKRLHEMGWTLVVTGTITGWHITNWGNGVYIDGRPYRLAHLPSRFYTAQERAEALGTQETLYIDELGVGRFTTAQFPDPPRRDGEMVFTDKDHL